MNKGAERLQRGVFGGWTDLCNLFPGTNPNRIFQRNNVSGGKLLSRFRVGRYFLDQILAFECCERE